MEDYHTQDLVDAEPAVQRSSLRRVLVDVFETAVLSLLLFLSINLVSARIRIESISMVPTLQPGDFVIVNKLAYSLGSIQRGDIVVFRLPQDESQRYIKRIIGLPGDVINIQDGEVWAGGIRLDEPYLQVATHRGGTWEVPEGTFFVMGDNRNNSSDSRVWGTVPAENIIGKAMLVYWPPEEWGILGGAVYAAGSP